MGRGEGPSSLRLGKESNAHCCGLQAGNWQWLMTKLQATPVSFNWNKLKLQLVLISLSRGYGLCVSELWDWIGLDWTGLEFPICITNIKTPTPTPTRSL